MSLWGDISHSTHTETESGAPDARTSLSNSKARKNRPSKFLSISFLGGKKITEKQYLKEKHGGARTSSHQASPCFSKYEDGKKKKTKQNKQTNKNPHSLNNLSNAPSPKIRKWKNKQQTNKQINRDNRKQQRLSSEFLLVQEMESSRHRVSFEKWEWYWTLKTNVSWKIF